MGTEAITARRKISTTTISKTTTDNLHMKITEDEDGTKDIINNENSDENNTKIYEIYDDKIEALPIEDKETVKDSSSWLVVAPVVTLCAIVLLVVVVAGLVWNRKRKSSQAVSLQITNEDCLAANAFLEEAEYHQSIIKVPSH